MVYKINKQGGVIRLKDMAYIPEYPGNTDYQEYLEWVAKGNTPDPAYSQTELDDKAAQEAKILSIENTLSTKLPSLDSIQKEIDALKEIEEVKTFLKKLAEVVYVHIKNDNV